MKAAHVDKISKPNRLKEGQTVGVIAIAAPSEKERFEAGLKSLESLGFKVKVALDPTASFSNSAHLFSSDTPSRRAKALHELFEDKEVACIIAVRGAYGTMEVLPLLDFAKIALNPKPVVGFSDVTALLIALYQHAHMTCLHGPSIESAFSKAHTDKDASMSVSALCNILTGVVENPYKDIHLKPFLGGAAARGKLTGGNLSLLASLMGTAWEPSFDEHIVFIEEIGERPYRIHRMLLQMKLANKFDKVRGVLLGSFSNCTHPQNAGASLEEVLTDIFSSIGVPVWQGAPFGHEILNLPMPLGIEASIDNGALSFLEAAFA